MNLAASPFAASAHPKNRHHERGKWQSWLAANCPAIKPSVRESRPQFGTLVEEPAFGCGRRNPSEQFVDRPDGGNGILKVLVVLMPDML
jgi:hypothetical protein